MALCACNGTNSPGTDTDDSEHIYGEDIGCYEPPVGIAATARWLVAAMLTLTRRTDHRLFSTRDETMRWLTDGRTEIPSRPL